MSWRKRTLGGLLVVLMLLNVAGYYSMLLFMRSQAAVALSQRLQATPHERGGTFVIKLRLANPYLSSANAYEAVSGDFTYQGNVYQMLRQRVYNDTLYVVCMHDERATRANEKVKEYARSFGEEREEQAAVIVMAAEAKYFMAQPACVQHGEAGWVANICYPVSVTNYRHLTSRIPFHPPEYFC